MGYNYLSQRCLLLKPAREGQRLQQQEYLSSSSTTTTITMEVFTYIGP